ncbi:right-handed parallel beta-helix repeat-containing protein [Halorubrum sp. LN27]|uniref:right-handed parallel beta-helix repeat-containing protein n=1 Tax=Halorubrum sp. LN27 TaxID=2801032 RepID=UPI001909ABE2|nr:right-handed parallel beta-helix repeat-containing protein [Halorubrum sp. LN27]
MALTIKDFVEQVDSLTLDDVPPEVRKRVNDELQELTGDGEGEPAPPQNPDAIIVSKNLDGRDGYNNIQPAVDSAEPGATIFVEPGTYTEAVLVETDDLTLVGAEGVPTVESTGTGYQEEGDPVSPLEIVGEGVEVRDIAVQAVEGEGFNYGIQISGVSGASDVTLENVTIDGSSGFNTGEFGTGVRVRGAPNTILDGVEVNGGSDVDYGIRVQEPGTEVLNCTVNNCNRAIDVQSSDQLVKGNTINGITEDSPGGWYKDPMDDGLEDDEFPSGKGIRVSTTPSGSNNTVENNEINDCATGIEAFGSDSNIVGNDITSCSTGITVANGASNYTIENNEISEGSSRGISVFSGSTDAHTIQNNTVSNQASGIVLSGADNNTLSGNTITDNTYNGIWLSDGAGSATGNDIENNTVSNNGFASSAYPGIYLGGAEDNTLTGNDVNGNAAQGIYVYDSSGTVVDDNTLENNGEGVGDYIYSGILLWTVTDSEVTNNTLTDNYYRGIWIESYTDPLTVSGNSITLRDTNYQKIVTNEA